MTFFLRHPCRITHDYEEPRVTAFGKHGAWDLAPPHRTPIYAPEAGPVYIVVAVRNELPHHDIFWPTGEWFEFSNYFSETYGVIVILVGKRYKHLWAHIDFDEAFRQLRGVGYEHIKQRTRDNYRAYVDRYHNLRTPWQVPEGHLIGKTGIAGFDDAPHVHYEVHPADRGRHERIDPATVWPEEWKTRWGGA